MILVPEGRYQQLYCMEKYSGRSVRREMKDKKMSSYALQLIMLRKLLDNNLINQEEYQKILRKLKQDYKIISNIDT